MEAGHKVARNAEHNVREGRIREATRPAAVVLGRHQIETALPKVRPGLTQYLAILNSLRHQDASASRDFQRAFNHFYRVRRGTAWQHSFYRELGTQLARPSDYGGVLKRLYESTGRVEASFASKLVATVDPRHPVIDAFVLGHTGLRLRRTGEPVGRIASAVAVHTALAAAMTTFLMTDDGRYLVDRFEKDYPYSGVTAMKMLDLVLWQTRS